MTTLNASTQVVGPSEAKDEGAQSSVAVAIVHAMCQLAQRLLQDSMCFELHCHCMAPCFFDLLSTSRDKPKKIKQARSHALKSFMQQQLITDCLDIALQAAAVQGASYPNPCFVSEAARVHIWLDSSSYTVAQHSGPCYVTEQAIKHIPRSSS